MGSMRRLLFVSVVCVLSAGSAPASAATAPEWSREPGGRLEAVTVASGGSLYVTGQIATPHLSDAMVVDKLGPNGGRFWRHTWRGVGRDAWAMGTALAPAPGGGVYVGASWGRGEFAAPIVMRLSPAGHVLWRSELPNPVTKGQVMSLASDGRGVVAAVTSIGCCADFTQDGYLEALSPTGRVRWRTDFEAPGIRATWDSVRGVAIGAGGRIFAVGEIDRGVWSGTGPLPDQDIAVQMLSPGGHVAWTRILSDPGVRDQESATDVDVRGSLVVVSGAVDGRRFVSEQGWLGAFDVSGRRLWARRWGEGASFREAAAVDVSSWGPIYVVANRITDRGAIAQLRRYSRDGHLVKATTLDVRDGRGTDVTTDPGVYVTIGRRIERWPR
jgi:hypothetical protein